MKHEDFICQPMVRRSVKVVPGVGEIIGRSLERVGITTAKKLYGHYLSSSPAEFKVLIERHGGNVQHQRDAYRAFKEWEDQHC